MAMLLMTGGGLALDHQDRWILTGSVEVIDEPGLDFDVTVSTAPVAGAPGIEINELLIRRRPDGPPITPGAVHGLHLRDLEDRVLRSLPVYEMGEDGVLVVDATSHVPTSGAHSDHPIELRPPKPRKPRVSDDMLRQAAAAWWRAEGSTKTERDRAAADVLKVSANTIRVWRHRYPDRWMRP